MKPIYRYRDYRAALRDFYASSKATQPQFSYSAFSKKAGLASPNYLKLVMDGQRNLTPATIQLFGKAMGLSGEELNFFESLVLENQAEITVERQFYSQRLDRLRRGFATETTRKLPTALLDSPLKPALLLCAARRTLAQAVEFARSELNISGESAEQMIQVLLKEGELIAEGEEQRLRPGDRHVMMSDPKGRSARLERFLRDGLDDASSVFSARYPRGAAKFLSLLLTAPAGSLKDMFVDLRSALEKVSEKYDPAPDTEVGIYRMQLQIYRVKKDKD